MGATRIAAAALPLLLSFPIATADAQYQEPAHGKVRTYYIAAEEVRWDFAPRGRNLTGTPTAEGGVSDEASAASVKARAYLKAVYREYTDATFKTLKQRPPQWEHLGILGPLIRAEVGDTIKVFFKNGTKLWCSMHPHGLAYAKSSEGALYNDGTAGADKKDDAVPPGGTYIYTWLVPERAGPGPGDPSSILWMYHSHFVEPKDLNTGLLGPIIVTARGLAEPDGKPKDVDREFITAFAVFDETDSWYFEANIQNFIKKSADQKITDPFFRKLNLLYTINGLIEGNLPMMLMRKGERVRWYLFANGNEDDVHTPHWHGQTILIDHMRTDIVHLGPMTMAVADMIPDNLGTWLYHCHVNDHLKGGMQAMFIVVP